MQNCNTMLSSMVLQFCISVINPNRNASYPLKKTSSLITSHGKIKMKKKMVEWQVTPRPYLQKKFKKYSELFTS